MYIVGCCTKHNINLGVGEDGFEAIVGRYSMVARELLSLGFNIK